MRKFLLASLLLFINTERILAFDELEYTKLQLLSNEGKYEEVIPRAQKLLERFYNNKTVNLLSNAHLGVDNIETALKVIEDGITKKLKPAQDLLISYGNTLDYAYEKKKNKSYLKKINNNLKKLKKYKDLKEFYNYFLANYLSYRSNDLRALSYYNDINTETFPIANKLSFNLHKILKNTNLQESASYHLAVFLKELSFTSAGRKQIKSLNEKAPSFLNLITLSTEYNDNIVNIAEKYYALGVERTGAGTSLGYLNLFQTPSFSPNLSIVTQLQYKQHFKDDFRQYDYGYLLFAPRYRFLGTTRTPISLSYKFFGAINKRVAEDQSVKFESYLSVHEAASEFSYLSKKWEITLAPYFKTESYAQNSKTNANALGTSLEYSFLSYARFVNPVLRLQYEKEEIKKISTQSDKYIISLRNDLRISNQLSIIPIVRFTKNNSSQNSYDYQIYEYQLSTNYSFASSYIFNARAGIFNKSFKHESDKLIKRNNLSIGLSYLF